MTNTPIAAIIIAARNAQATIERCVHSALAQTQVGEVCVVDDASTDMTAQVAQSCDDGTNRLSIIQLDQNRGPSAARNLGLERTISPWVGVVDADDYLLDGRFSALLQHHEEADLIADDLIRAAPNEIRKSPAWGLTSVSAVSFERFVRRDAIGADLALGFMKPIIRRSFLDQFGLRFHEELRLGEDFELYARALALGGRLLLTPVKGYVSVETPGSLSKEHSELDLYRLREASQALGSIRPMTYGERSALRLHYQSVDKRLQWRRLIAAVRDRNLADCASTFTSAPVLAHLMFRLGEQAWVRSRRLVAGSRDILSAGLVI